MIGGSIVALVTPMQSDGAIDWDALHNLVEMHIAEKTGAIVAVGTTGESATLSVTEHLEVIRKIVAQSGGRIPVIAGTGANSTQEAIELTGEAKALGVDACLIVTPYYNKPTQQGLYLHHKALADAVSIPQILYNVPGRTACDMLPDTVVALAEIDNIVAIKEATGDLARGKEIIDRCGDRLSVFSGDDATAVALMLAGAKGNISVTANVVPRRMADICAQAVAGDGEGAQAEDQKLADLHEILFVESNPIPVKWALHRMGLIKEGIRLPLTPLSACYHAAVERVLKNHSLII